MSTPQTSKWSKFRTKVRDQGFGGAFKWIVKSVESRTLGKMRDARKAKIEDILAASNIQDRFTKIYESNYWGNGESRSGNGSEIAVANEFVHELETFLQAHPMELFFDAPCGDYNWMRQVELPTQTRYLGGDIVPPLVERLNGEFGSEHCSFQVFDLTKDEFPEAGAWLCRDCLFHLAFADIQAVLRNFANSKVPYALLTCNENVPQNKDIPTGNWRLLDLRLPPISLGEPVQKLKDSSIDGQDRFVGVWRREDILQAAQNFDKSTVATGN